MGKSEKTTTTPKKPVGIVNLKVTPEQIELSMDGPAKLINMGIGWMIHEMARQQKTNVGSIIAQISMAVLEIEHELKAREAANAKADEAPVDPAPVTDPEVK